MSERQLILIIALILSSLDMRAQGQKKDPVPAPTVPPVFTALAFRQGIPTASRPAGIAPDQYVQGLGFVCKKEWAVEKSTGLPFRFRLGSLEYTDRMEGKIKSPPTGHH